jgi:hypothetical protein
MSFAPRGFGKKYFTLASIQAHSSGVKLHASITAILSKSLFFGRLAVYRAKQVVQHIRLLIFALLFISLVHSSSSEEDSKPP